ncbi:MAG TPA: hypothetical protein VEW04_01340 [Allosphingosinicella sp.]|nr:hypothetical protein [Allosphingosinicella sp.]
MKAPRLIFGAAGIYGLIVLLPLFFMAPWLEPAPNRPEDYYGFLGAASVMQLVYLTIASDPVRFRPFMLLGALSKAVFFVTILTLWLEARTAGAALTLATIDGAIGLAFFYAWWRTPA